MEPGNSEFLHILFVLFNLFLLYLFANKTFSKVTIVREDTCVKRKRFRNVKFQMWEKYPDISAVGQVGFEPGSTEVRGDKKVPLRQSDSNSGFYSWKAKEMFFPDGHFYKKIKTFQNENQGQDQGLCKIQGMGTLKTWSKSRWKQNIAIKKIHTDEKNTWVQLIRTRS